MKNFKGRSKSSNPGTFKNWWRGGAVFQTLATIRRDAPIDFKLPEKVWRETFDVKVAEKVFTEYGFKSLFARLQI